MCVEENDMGTNCKRLYFHLAGRVADILENIDLMRDPPEKVLGHVRGWLADAMKETEELYLQATENEAPPAEEGNMR